MLLSSSPEVLRLFSSFFTTVVQSGMDKVNFQRVRLKDIIALLNKHIFCASVHLLISGNGKENTENHFEYRVSPQPQLPGTDRSSTPRSGWMDGLLQRCSTLCGGESISLGGQTLSFIDKGSYVKPVVCDVFWHILRYQGPQRDLKATLIVG